MCIPRNIKNRTTALDIDNRWHKVSSTNLDDSSTELSSISLEY